MFLRPSGSSLTVLGLVWESPQSRSIAVDESSIHSGEYRRWTDCLVLVFHVCVSYQCVSYQCVSYVFDSFQCVSYECVRYMCVSYQCVRYIIIMNGIISTTKMILCHICRQL